MKLHICLWNFCSGFFEHHNLSLVSNTAPYPVCLNVTLKCPLQVSACDVLTVSAPPCYSFNQCSFTSALSLGESGGFTGKWTEAFETFGMRADCQCISSIFKRNLLQSFPQLYMQSIPAKCSLWKYITLQENQCDGRRNQPSVERVQLELETSISKPHIYESNNRLLWYNPLLNIINRVILSKLSKSVPQMCFTCSYVKFILH